MPKPLNLCRRNSHAVWSWPIVWSQTGRESLINAPYRTHTVLAMQPTYRTTTAVVDSSPRRRGAVNKWMSKGWKTNLISNVLFKVRILVSTLFYFSWCLVWPSCTQMTSVKCLNHCCLALWMKYGSRIMFPSLHQVLEFSNVLVIPGKLVAVWLPKLSSELV